MVFKPFYNDWVDLSPIFVSRANHVRSFDYLNVNLDYTFFQNLKFDKESLKKYRVNAAIKSAELLGSRPALCISGGIDSQAMLHCWLEAGLKFDAVILVFKNDLNSMDVDHAKMVCQRINLPLVEVELDVVNFLNFNNFTYASMYNSCSPHFNCHYKLFNILKDRGYTGVCCGGDAPNFNGSNNTWGNNFSRNQHTFIKYTEVSKFPCIGNFLGFYPALAWAIALHTLPSILPGSVAQPNSLVKLNKLNSLESIDIEQDKIKRYHSKIIAYDKIGLEIYPQDQKYSGFENVKKYLESLTNDGWEFEKRYRIPLENHFNLSMSVPIFRFKDNIENYISQLYSDNLSSM